MKLKMILREVTLLLLILCFSGNLMGQTAKIRRTVPTRGSVPVTPVETMPPFSKGKIGQEDLVNDAKKDLPFRFGVEFNTNFTTTNSGVNHILPDGGKIWRLNIRSADALSISLIFENFNIPNGATIHLYNLDKTSTIGAYTSANNRNDGFLGTELVFGEEITVEYFEPVGVVGQGTLTIATVVHGYRGIANEKSVNKLINSGGDCNIDVSCSPIGDKWKTLKQSVALIFDGGALCSGALVNNTCVNGDPYFLTANHCMYYSGTLILRKAGTFVFRFNWESDSATIQCPGTGITVGTSFDVFNGSELLINDPQSDFALLKISKMVVQDAIDANLVYAGWDNSDSLIGTETTGIHHPSGDVKKICVEKNAVKDTTEFNFNFNLQSDVWRVEDWDEGVTEPGSSGSPLFDESLRIIGQLFRGDAACAGLTDNGDYDVYGRFGISWDLGLSTFLAPAICGGAPATIDFYDPGAPTIADDAGISKINTPLLVGCSDVLQPTVTLQNFGNNVLNTVDIVYSYGGVPPTTFSWPDGPLAVGASTTVLLDPIIVTITGTQTFTVATEMPNSTVDSLMGNDGATLDFNYAAGDPIDLEINFDCYPNEISWELLNFDGSPTSYSGAAGDFTGVLYFQQTLCVTPGCYTFNIFDTFGDGMKDTSLGVQLMEIILLPMLPYPVHPL
ncbi:MAG: trypsin-like peptidase domain-containing protein [Bacteroidetes bacterium]|nr:trypsin-like peptidase domain-containing protein [Bacteroidota bacterium]